jgi:sodium-dependent phosphate cotransporter
LTAPSQPGPKKGGWVFSRTPNTALGYVIRILGLIFFLYIFILSIKLLGGAFKGMGKEYAEALIMTTSNPFVGLFIGILATSIIQSSSTTTSILVGAVAAGLINIEGAIPIVMGANIGTTVTNTLVSITHITRIREFARAFSGAIVHDIFNILSVLILFPLQYFTNFLGEFALFLEQTFSSAGGITFVSPVKVITAPIVDLIFKDILQSNGWFGSIVAVILLLLALKFLVDIMKSLVLARVEGFFDRYIFRTVFRALFFGMILTAIIQSSSITTSLVIPLIGAGVLTLRQVFPYTLGANVGTTVTAIMAALVTQNEAAVAVAFSHLLFNICGIAIFLPLAKIPISLAKGMSRLTLRSRIIPIALIVLIFFLIPLALITLVR